MLCFSDVAFLGKYLSHNRIQRTCHPDELSCCRCIYTMWPVLENTEDIFVSKQMRPLLIKYKERGGIKEWQARLHCLECLLDTKHQCLQNLASNSSLQQELRVSKQNCRQPLWQ